MSTISVTVSAVFSDAVRILVFSLLTITDLGNAARRPDRFADAAAELGAGRLSPWLTVGSHAERMTAILAAPLTRDGSWTLLEPLVADMASADRSIAASAGRSAATITARIDRDAIEHDDIPAPELAAAAIGCGAIARESDVWPDVRIDALACATSLAIALGADAPADVLALPKTLATDADPQIAEAARAYADVLAPL